MSVPYRRSAFLFRHDLRVDDNLGLQRAAALSEEVVPCIVLEPAELHEAALHHDKALQFQEECLHELETSLRARGAKLYRMLRTLPEALESLFDEVGVDAVFLNRDPSPRGRRLEGHLEARCLGRGVFLGRSHDQVLFSPASLVDERGTPGRFQEFLGRVAHLDVPKPRALGATRFVELASSDPMGPLVDRLDRELYVRGGRANGMALLQGLGEYERYEEEADIPALDATTGLSAHLRFGTVSPRELWWAVRRRLGPAHPLLEGLLKREYMLHHAWFQPRLAEREAPELLSRPTRARFRGWCAGRTGVPLVDAGMRQLTTSGFLNHRMRCVVASYLIWDLGVSAAHGERFFARHLVDHDPVLSRANWRSVARTRRIDPWREQHRIDPDGRYIREWIGELPSPPPRRPDIEHPAGGP